MTDEDAIIYRPHFDGWCQHWYHEIKQGLKYEIGVKSCSDERRREGEKARKREGEKARRRRDEAMRRQHYDKQCGAGGPPACMSVCGFWMASSPES